MTETGTMPPSSPATIPLDATEVELRSILEAWKAQAEAEQLPNKLWVIGWWLGAPFGHQSRNWRRHVADGVEILATSDVASRNIAANAWNIRRSVVANVGDNTLASWTWNYVAQDAFETPPSPAVIEPESYFLPGHWTDIIEPNHKEAAATKATIESNASRKQRDALAAKMMVGLDI